VTRLCLIGAGNHATRNIYPYLHWLKNTAVVANCDLRIDEARKVAERFRIPKFYSDIHEMLRQEKPDAAVVCTGPAGHCAIAIDLLQHGVHVYTEKPTAPSLADALRMLDAKEKSGLICMTAYKKRFAPAYIKAKKLIDDQADFGEPAGMNITRASAAGAVAADKMRSHLLDWTCHTLDLGVFLFGPVTNVTTTTVDRNGRYAWTVVMRHRNGAVSHQLFTNATGMPEEEVYICGSGGVVIKVSNSINLLATKNGRPFDGHFPSFTTGSNFGDVEQGYSGELVEFVSAIQEQREPEANIRQACHALAIFEAMWTSAQSGGKPADVEFQP
jgi:predicted dehydrogenase